MSLTISPATQVPKEKRFILYGPPKTCKTPAALAYGAYLREKNPKSRTLYVAADADADSLPSLPDESWREWIDVVRGTPPFDPLYNPYNDAVQIVMTNWKEVNPDYELIVWDTLTRDAEKVLQFCANKEYFSSQKREDKHITIGDPDSPYQMNIPLPGDYLAMQAMTRTWMDALIRQPLHCVIVCHEEEAKDKQGVTRIGPATVGKAMIMDLPAYFTGILYTERVGVADPKTMKITPTLYIYSDTGDDRHIAGIRHTPTNGSPRNPIPKVKVGDDLVAYWRLFFDSIYPENKEG